MKLLSYLKTYHLSLAILILTALVIYQSVILSKTQEEIKKLKRDINNAEYTITKLENEQESQQTTIDDINSKLTRLMWQFYGFGR